MSRRRGEELSATHLFYRGVPRMVEFPRWTWHIKKIHIGTKTKDQEVLGETEAVWAWLLSPLLTGTISSNCLQGQSLFHELISKTMQGSEVTPLTNPWLGRPTLGLDLMSFLRGAPRQSWGAYGQVRCGELACLSYSWPCGENTIIWTCRNSYTHLLIAQEVDRRGRAMASLRHPLCRCP